MFGCHSDRSHAGAWERSNLGEAVTPFFTEVLTRIQLSQMEGRAWERGIIFVFDRKVDFPDQN